MGVFVIFAKLASDLRLVEAQLTAALRDQDSTRIHAALTRKVAELGDALEAHLPTSETERREMIAFFAGRAIRGPLSLFSDRDLDIALRLSNSSIAPLHRRRVSRKRRSADRTISLESGFAEPQELSDHIARSSERLVAIGLSHRYLAVSGPHAASNHTQPARMIDLHLQQVIGKRPYLDRAAPALKRSFAADPAVYIYPRTCKEGERRFIRCEVHPVRDRAEQLYCSVMRLTDVTRSMVCGEPV